MDSLFSSLTAPSDKIPKAAPRRMEEGGAVGAPTTEQIIKLIQDAAFDSGIAEQYHWIPVAIAYGESGFNPAAVGDGGKSVGIYQLHENGVGSGMGQSRLDAQTNINKMMPGIASAIKGYLGRTSAGNRTGLDVLQNVWLEALRPEAQGLAARAPSIYRWAEANILGGGTTQGAQVIDGTGTDIGDDALNLDPTDPNSPTYDPTAVAQIGYYNALAADLAASTGINAGELAQTIRAFNLTWETDNKLKGNQADYYTALSKNLSDTFGLDVQKFDESIRQFDLNYKQMDSANLGTLTNTLLDSRLKDRQQAGLAQVDLFKTLQPNAVDSGGKVAGALGRMFKGVTDGGAFPTESQNVRLSLTNPADMETETTAAEAAARRILGLLDAAPTGMAEGGIVPPDDLSSLMGGMGGGMMGAGAAPPMAEPMAGAIDPLTGEPLPPGTPNPDDPALVADGQGNWVPAQGAPAPMGAPGMAPPDDLAAMLMGSGAPMAAADGYPKRAAEGDGDLQDMILRYLTGLDPTLKALTAGLSGVDILGQLFGDVPNSVVDQLLSTLVPSGGTLGIGGPTQASKEFAANYEIALKRLGIDEQTAANQAASIQATLEMGKLDNDTKLKIAGIVDATNKLDIATRSGDTRYVAEIQTNAQKYVADLNYSLGLGQLDVSRGDLNLRRQQALAEAQANPRRLFETLAFQAQQKPTELASALDTFVQPDFSAGSIGAGAGDLASSLTGSASSPMGWGYSPPKMAQGGMGGGEVLIVGDKGNNTNIARGTEEATWSPPGTIVAPFEAGEEMSMDNAIKAIIGQVTGAKANGGPLSNAQSGLFGMLANGETPQRAAGGYVPLGAEKLQQMYDVFASTPGFEQEAAVIKRAMSGGGMLSGAESNHIQVVFPDAQALAGQAAPPPPATNWANPANSGFNQYKNAMNDPGLVAQKAANKQAAQDQYAAGQAAANAALPGFMASLGAISEQDLLRDFSLRRIDGQYYELGTYTGALKPADTLTLYKRLKSRILPAAPDLPADPIPADPAGGGSNVPADPVGGGGGGGQSAGVQPTLPEVGAQVVGAPLARQAGRTSLFDALGGASGSFRKWSTDTFGQTGLPTYRFFNRWSPTQRGAYASYASAGGVNPDDIVAGIARDFAGYNPNRVSGQMANVTV